jgi:hypothetical protein
MPKPISQLSTQSAEVPWLWHGFLARGATTLFTGLWKAGKTTMLAHLLRALENDCEFAGQEVKAARAIVISEEAELHWGIRRDDLQLGDHIDIMSRPFLLGRPALPAWERFIAHVADQVTDHEYALVVFDSLPNLWPVRDENAAADVIAALTPLNAITEANAAVLLVAHPRKGDAGEGQATRGSGAVTGFVDVIVEMRRHDPERKADTRRTLTTYSRFEETPGELVLSYDPDHPARVYQAIGTKADAKAADRSEIIDELLPDEPPGSTVEEIASAWPQDGNIAKPSAKTLRRDLKAAVQKEQLRQQGTGKKNDPERFWRAKNSITDSPPPRGEAVPNRISTGGTSVIQ